MSVQLSQLARMLILCFIDNGELLLRFYSIVIAKHIHHDQNNCWSSPSNHLPVLGCAFEWALYSIRIDRKNMCNKV